jgi:hypothetical protein
MTRPAAGDAVLPACPRTAAAFPPAAGTAAGTAAARTGPGPRTRRPGRPCRVRLPFLRHRPGAPHQPELRYVRPLHRPRPPRNAASFAGWPADPGRDIS